MGVILQPDFIFRINSCWLFRKDCYLVFLLVMMSDQPYGADHLVLYQYSGQFIKCAQKRFHHQSFSILIAARKDPIDRHHAE